MQTREVSLKILVGHRTFRPVACPAAGRGVFVQVALVVVHAIYADDGAIQVAAVMAKADDLRGRSERRADDRKSGYQVDKMIRGEGPS